MCQGAHCCTVGPVEPCIVSFDTTHQSINLSCYTCKADPAFAQVLGLRNFFAVFKANSTWRMCSRLCNTSKVRLKYYSTSYDSDATMAGFRHHGHPILAPRCLMPEADITEVAAYKQTLPNLFDKVQNFAKFPHNHTMMLSYHSAAAAHIQAHIIVTAAWCSQAGSSADAAVLPWQCVRHCALLHLDHRHSLCPAQV